MMRIVVAVVVALGFAAQGGGGAAGVHVWKAADLAAKGKTLGQKLDSQKSANPPTPPTSRRPHQRTGDESAPTEKDQAWPSGTKKKRT